MEENNKLPLKRVELSLSKFNEVAIPHHLDLLRQHKANINKHEECGDYIRVRAEQTNAQRVAGQLRSLLTEMEALRRQVRSEDLPKFDALTQRSRDLTLKSIMDYLGVIESSCRALVYSSHMRRNDTSPRAARRRAGVAPAAGAGAGAAASVASTDSVGVLPPDADCEPHAPLLQLQVDEHELALASREEALRGWGALQGEVRALHEAWQHVQAAALAQREPVAAVAAATERAGADVGRARAHLAGAERLRAGAWCAGGALAGALAGGPVGLAVGAKAGAAAALAGSLLGYLGARLLGRRAVAPAPDPAPAPAPAPADKQKDD